MLVILVIRSRRHGLDVWGDWSSRHLVIVVLCKNFASDDYKVMSSLEIDLSHKAVTMAINTGGIWSDFEGNSIRHYE